MAEFPPKPPGESKPEKSRGHNVHIEIVFARHAQKAAAGVFNKELSGISASLISPKGGQLSRRKGAEVLKEPTKGYITSVARTKETLQEMLKGAEITDPQELEKMSQKYLGFEAVNLAKPSMEQYTTIVDNAKAEYIARHFPVRKYDELTLDEQEQVMEAAEEPALQWYLDHGDKRPDPNTWSPKEMAGVVAYKLNRFANLPERIEDGKQIELVSVGHKTSTEAFLKQLIGFSDLSEIGGSLKTLDDWKLDVDTNAQGQKTVKLLLRGKEYPVDADKLRELAEIGRNLLEKPERAIDRPPPAKSGIENIRQSIQQIAGRSEDSKLAPTPSPEVASPPPPMKQKPDLVKRFARFVLRIFGFGKQQ